MCPTMPQCEHIGRSCLSLLKEKGTTAVARVGSREADDNVLKDKESTREGDPDPIERCLFS